MSEPRRGVVSRLDHLRWGAVSSALCLCLGVPISAVLAGRAGAWGFALGVALVTASYAVSSVVIAWADSVNPSLIMPCGLVTYAMKFTIIVAVLSSCESYGRPERMSWGLGIVVCAVSWSVAQIVWIVRTQHPYSDPDYSRRHLSG